MGAQCSCTAEPNGLTLEEVIPMSKPQLLVNNALVSRSVNLTAVAPLSKTSGDSEIEFEEEVGEIPVAKKESPVTKMLSRMKTNDPEATSQRDDSNDLLKKATSFFRFSSLESRYQANPIEHANEVHGDVWKLQNIKLKSIIQMSQGKYLWEAHNISNDKRCTVKISLIEASRLSHSNFAKTENFLRELGGISNPNVIDIYSFSIFESEFHNKPYLVVVVVQEPVKCSLRDIHTHKTEQETLWNQNQLLIIIRDIYAGLVACKEKHLIHGRLALENALVSEDLERVLVGDFNIKLPLVKENKTTSSMGVVRFSKNSLGGTFLVPENAAHTQIIPDEKDIHDLTVLVLKLMTNDENIGYSFDLLKKDERYRRAYQKVFEALDLVTSRVRNPVQVINDVTHLIDKNHKKLCLDIPEDFDNKCQQESYVDLVFLKIDCYELLNQHGTALEVYSELISILENKDRKGMKEYLEYVKCVNRTIKHYLSLNDWLKAKDICAEMNCILKKDPLLKKTLKQYPKEYINFTFLLGNISEGLGEPDKAIALYAKGLSFCSNQHLGLEAYSSTLKRISNLYMQKNEHVQALECLKKLVDYYETQEGYFVDRADGYLNMGDILIQQGNLGQAVKMYLRGLDNIKKGKMNNSEALLNIIDKIVSGYKSLHEDENALRYMIDSLEIKRKAFGRESVEYMEEIKEIAAAHVRLQDYDAALNHYLIYQKIAASDPEKKEQYLESLVFVGDAYAELRMYEKARKSFETYASLEKEAKGVESKEFLCSQDKLASIYFKEGKAKESLEIQLNCLILKEKMFTDDDFYMIVSLSNIGDTYFADKQYNQALESHKESLNKLESRKAEFKEEYSQLLLRIALDYDKCGDSGQALKAIHKSLQVSQKEGMESDMTNTIKMYEIMSRGKETRKRSLDFIKLTRQID